MTSEEKPEIPVHIAIFGHIDAGKTAIARCLTEIVSTAGLDKHTQAQKRGITIDLGFTFFRLNQYLITLVDAPGHADLIQSAVSAANIIDIAFIVIDAVKGPQIQTGEHLLILDLLRIPKLLVLLNKIDLISPSQIPKVEASIHAILKETHFIGNYEIFPVSAAKNEGFEKVKQTLISYLDKNPIIRDKSGSFKFLFDHHFAKKGQGTILTGTVLSGSAKIGEDIIILPPEIKTKIKSIQKAKNTSIFAEAGDRCGISVPDVNPDQLYRGCFAVNNLELFEKAEIILITVHQLSLFKRSLRFGQSITVNHGMNEIRGNIFPFKIVPTEISKSDHDLRIGFEPEQEKTYSALLWLEKSEFIQKHDILLLSRLDLPPNELRIIGSATICETLKKPIEFCKLKVKHGTIKHPDHSASSVIVEGLSQSIEGARSLLGLSCEPPFGKIINYFGAKGNIEVEVKENSSPKPKKGDSVELRIYKIFHLEKSNIKS